MRIWVGTLLLFFFFKGECQNINTYAGNGTSGYSGDGGLATLAQLNKPVHVIPDMNGNVLIADLDNHCIRKVNPAGIITTIVGIGISGFSGDNGPALSAKLNMPAGIAIDSQGNLFIADQGNHRIRRVDAFAGTITTVAGWWTSGYSGDGMLATSSSLSSPSAVAIGPTGDLYIADEANNRIRKVDANGVISTVVGNGTYAFAGDGGLATSASIKYPSDIIFDKAGNLYISDYWNFRIRKVDTLGIINTVAGGGSCGSPDCGDGGQATAAAMGQSGVMLDAVGNMFISDQKNNKIRKVDTTGIITTVVGTGVQGYGGDGGLASLAWLNYPTKSSFDAFGNLYIAEINNNRIRIVNNMGVVGIGTKNQEQKPVIYPNPNTGTFCIENLSIGTKVNLYNSLGDMVYQNEFSDGKFKLENLKTGVYTIKIYTNLTVVSTTRIIVTN